MGALNTASTYGSVAKFFHWVIFLLVFSMLVFGFFMGDVPKDWQRFVYNTHKLTGLTILVLVMLRLCWALINKKPALVMTSAIEKIAEHTVHGLLYAFLMLMPILGWIGSSAGGRPPKLGDWVIGLPLGEDKVLKEWAFHWHGIVAWIIIGLVTIHVLAALYHHFIRRDDVLRRMLP